VPHYVYRPPAGAIEIPPPEVVGSTRSNAEANASLRNVSVYWIADPSSDAPPGTILSEVIGWNPVSPQSVVGQIESSEHLAIITLGSEIGLTVAGRAPRATVPNVVGVTEGSAVARLTQLGMISRPIDVCATGSGVDSVVAQSPPAGTRVEAGSAITLVTNNSC
jgi:beta-lactam-binding protein with PASTA domain